MGDDPLVLYNSARKLLLEPRDEASEEHACLSAFASTGHHQAHDCFLA